jgi:hypothetical protein
MVPPKRNQGDESLIAEGRLITAGASRRNKRVRLINLLLVVNADLLQDRPEDLTGNWLHASL